MERLKILTARLRALFHKETVLGDIEEELRIHVEMEMETNLERGMQPEEARAAALKSVGDRGRNADLGYDARGGGRLESLWQDLRYGARMLARNLGFTLIVALTLALGVGANTAIFSVINGVLLKPLAFRDPEQLFMLWAENPGWQPGLRELPPANSDLREWRAAATSLEQIAAFQTKRADLSDDGNPERVGGVSISTNLLPMLGVQPVLGRQFSMEEGQPGQDRLVIISYDLWRRRFGGDAGILGEKITINQVKRTIIGVMPEGFHFPQATEMPQGYRLAERADLWTPLAKEPAYWEDRVQRQLILIGRLKAGVGPAQAQLEMDGVAARQAIAYPQTHDGWRVWMKPLFNQIVDQTRAPLLILLGAVGLLLLIACANVASLLLARAASREREMAVRAALGAGRARIIRQLLTESLMLSALGGGGGLLLGFWGLKLLLNFLPPNAPRIENVILDTNVLLFTGLISVITGLLFGLTPAWRLSRVNLAEALKAANRTSVAGRSDGGHRALVTAQVALAVVLLIGAALTLQSFSRLLAVDPGFKPEGVAAFDVLLPWARYSDEQKRGQFYEQARFQLGNLPGVRAVGAISSLPLTGNEHVTRISVEGNEPAPNGKEPAAEDCLITPGYFEAMGVGVVKGRSVQITDGADQPLVVIVNETLARTFFPKGDVVGKRIKRVLEDKEWRTIIGVVRDVRGRALETQVRPQIYHPLAQNPGEVDEMAMAVRADAWALASLRGAVQQEFKQLDAALPVANFRALTQLVSNASARLRFSALLLNVFAATALLLTVVGLYGVAAFGVNQRTREFGVRMALGARSSDVLRMALWHGMRFSLIGVALGLAASLALTRVMRILLFEVSAVDPATFALVGFFMIGVALSASYFPARRATKVDPNIALRCD